MSGDLTDLAALAELYEVQTSFVGADGKHRVASPDAVLAVLAALGAPVSGAASVKDAIWAERVRRHLEVLQPVSALDAVGGQVVTVALPRPVHPRDCWLSVTPTDGTVGDTHTTRLLPAIHRPLESSTVAGRAMDRYEVQVHPGPSRFLAPGYYALSVEGPGVSAESLLVVAPKCPVPARSWGAFLPLYALRTESDRGVGDYTDLADLARWVSGLGGGYVGTLPLYPALLDGPVEYSPYLPATRLGWNELYVDPAALPELEAAPVAKAILASSEFEEAVAHARRTALVDYPAAMTLVRRVLEPMSEALFASSSSRHDELVLFARARPDVVAYARFRADRICAANAARDAMRSADDATRADAMVHDGANHESAADDVSSASSGEAGGRSQATGDPFEHEMRYQLYAQWVADRQLSAVGANLFLDLPVGVHPQGFDPVWSPTSFVEGVEGGAPPDLFFAGGQRWGFRPLHPRALRADRYRYPIACLRHVMAKAKVLRLDHVMGLHRLYWIPQGAPATEGVYVGYDARELRAVARLEASRSGTAIVGEDLGTVPREVRTSMAQDRMLRSWVLEFEVSADTPLPDPPQLAMASIGTHDLPRFAGFWAAPARASWRRALGGDATRALRVCLEHMAIGPAQLMMLDIEDLWLERWPHNRPGTGPEAGNWQHRAARTLEEIRASDEIEVLLAHLDALRRQEATG